MFGYINVYIPGWQGQGHSTRTRNHLSGQEKYWLYIISMTLFPLFDKWRYIAVSTSNLIIHFLTPITKCHKWGHWLLCPVWRFLLWEPSNFYIIHIPYHKIIIVQCGILAKIIPWVKFQCFMKIYWSFNLISHFLTSVAKWGK